MNEQALKTRLKFVANNQHKSFNEVWKSLLLERFLVRLSHSRYKNKLIFKGGLLLSHYLIIARETVDIDFHARRLHTHATSIENVLIEICSTTMDDGFMMSLKSVVELDHNHMNYPGHRARLKVEFGKMKDHIQVDIGVGDVVSPKQISWELCHYKQTAIFEDQISLQVYPVETILAEKLETVVSRGAANSRMKDFHDLLLLCRKEGLLDSKQLNENIYSTFQNRKTKIMIPVKLTADDYQRLQPMWSAHLRTLGDTTLMNEINLWLIQTVKI